VLRKGMNNALSGVFAQLVGRRINKRRPRLNVCALEKIGVLVKVVNAVKMLYITFCLLEGIDRINTQAG
jgi:hypothetical protein